MRHPESGAKVDLTLYQREVDRLAKELGGSWKKMMFDNKSEAAIYEPWETPRNFLQILGVYLIVEKGLDFDTSDAAEVDAALDEISGRSF